MRILKKLANAYRWTTTQLLVFILGLLVIGFGFQYYIDARLYNSLQKIEAKLELQMGITPTVTDIPPSATLTPSATPTAQPPTSTRQPTSTTIPTLTYAPLPTRAPGKFIEPKVDEVITFADGSKRRVDSITKTIGELSIGLHMDEGNSARIYKMNDRIIHTTEANGCYAVGFVGFREPFNLLVYIYDQIQPRDDC